VGRNKVLTAKPRGEWGGGLCILLVFQAASPLAISGFAAKTLFRPTPKLYSAYNTASYAGYIISWESKGWQSLAVREMGSPLVNKERPDLSVI